MKRALVAAITALIAGTSIWLGSAPAYATPKPPKPPVNYSASIKVTPTWTYAGGGQLAVQTSCSQGLNVRVVTSAMLAHAVDLKHGGNLLIRVTSKTKPGKYRLFLWCAAKKGQTDALGVATVKIVKRFPPWQQPPTPALPRHFKANVIVSTGPAGVKKTAHAHKVNKKRH